MANSRNTANTFCNKKNYKNNLNKFVKNSINSKKHSVSTKINTKFSDLTMKALENSNRLHAKYFPKQQQEQQNKNINNVDYAAKVNDFCVKELLEGHNSFNRFTKNLHMPSFSEVRRRKSKNKIVRNVQRTNNIIGDVEKLIKQNADVERGAKKLRANNLFQPIYRKLKKQADLATATFREHEEKMKEKNKDKKFSQPPRKHDSIQEIMFSNSFKYRSDSSRLEQERNNWLHMLTKENVNCSKLEVQDQVKNSTTEQYFDCNDSLSDKVDNYEQKDEIKIETEPIKVDKAINVNATVDATQKNERKVAIYNNDEGMKRKNSSKMLIHFKDLLNQYLKKNSIGETRFFLSKEDVEFLRNIVEADEKYHQLHLEDHSLLKEILLSQLEEIQLHQNIVDNILKTLKVSDADEEDLRNLASKIYSSTSMKSGETIKLKDEKKEKYSTPIKSPSCDKCCHCSASKLTEKASPKDPSSYVRKTWIDERDIAEDDDDISCHSSSHEQLVKLLENEEGKKMQELLVGLLTRANDESKPKNLVNVRIETPLQAITERTEPNLQSSSFLNESFLNETLEKEDKNTGVALKEAKQENYIMIENYPPSKTVHPLNIIIEAYSALFFTKKIVSLETLEGAKNFYIRKDSSHFEMENVNYQNLIANPEKLNRILKFRHINQLTPLPKKVFESKLRNAASKAMDLQYKNSDSVFSMTTDEDNDLSEEDMDQIGFAVALFENYNCILQSIEEVNQYIKKSIETMKTHYQVAENEISFEKGDNTQLAIEEEKKICTAEVGCGEKKICTAEVGCGEDTIHVENDLDHVKDCVPIDDINVVTNNLEDVDTVPEETYKVNITVRDISKPASNTDTTVSELNLPESPSRIMRTIKRIKGTFFENGSLLALQSSLCLLVVSGLLLPDPVCL